MQTYGVDFGASRSSIAVHRDDNQIECLVPPGSGGRGPSIPTSVLLDRTGKLHVGYNAESGKRWFSAGYRRDVKSLVGASEVTLGGVSYSPTELVAAILRELHELGRPQPTDPVAMTVPAGWQGSARGHLTTAAHRAGFHPEQLQLIPEPIAAMAHVFGTAPGADERERTTIVYDLGGGTFDCAVARGRPGSFVVYGLPGGLSTVGGRAFDGVVREMVAETLGIDPPTDDAASIHAEQLLLEDCERIKELLSARTTVTAALTLGASITIERATFNDRIRSSLEETVQQCEQMLGENELRWADVDEIVVVGGSGQIPLVAELLSATGRPVRVAAEPELAVVRGAALIASGRVTYVDSGPVMARVRPEVSHPAAESSGAGAPGAASARQPDRADGPGAGGAELVSPGTAEPFGGGTRADRPHAAAISETASAHAGHLGGTSARKPDRTDGPGADGAELVSPGAAGPLVGGPRADRPHAAAASETASSHAGHPEGASARQPGRADGPGADGTKPASPGAAGPSADGPRPDRPPAATSPEAASSEVSGPALGGPKAGGPELTSPKAGDRVAGAGGTRGDRPKAYRPLSTHPESSARTRIERTVLGQAGPEQVSPEQVSPERAGPEQADRAQADRAQMGPPQMGLEQADQKQLGQKEAGQEEVGRV